MNRNCRPEVRRLAASNPAADSTQSRPGMWAEHNPSRTPASSASAPVMALVPMIKCRPHATALLPKDHAAPRDAAQSLGPETLQPILRGPAPLVAAATHRDTRVRRRPRDLLRAAAHPHSAGRAG